MGTDFDFVEFSRKYIEAPMQTANFASTGQAMWELANNFGDVLRVRARRVPFAYPMFFVEWALTPALLQEYGRARKLRLGLTLGILSGRLPVPAELQDFRLADDDGWVARDLEKLPQLGGAIATYLLRDVVPYWASLLDRMVALEEVRTMPTRALEATHRAVGVGPVAPFYGGPGEAELLLTLDVLDEGEARNLMNRLRSTVRPDLFAWCEDWFVAGNADR